MAKDVIVYPLPLESNIMVDPVEAAIPCQSYHHIRCCIEEDSDYRVIFQVGSSSFPAGKMPTAELLGHKIPYTWSLHIYS